MCVCVCVCVCVCLCFVKHIACEINGFTNGSQYGSSVQPEQPFSTRHFATRFVYSSLPVSNAIDITRRRPFHQNS